MAAANGCDAILNAADPRFVPGIFQGATWETALNPVVALELVASDVWSGLGVLGPEAFDAVPFLDPLSEYGSPWGMEERKPANALTCGNGSGRARSLTM